MTNPPTIIADIGGTNARFALLSESATLFDQAESLECNDYATLFDAIDAYLELRDIKHLGAICFAVAGPVKHQSMSFLNNNWSLSAEELSQRYQTENVQLLNDFEAISLSLPRLKPSDLHKIGGGRDSLPSEDFKAAVIGPGSGLGVGGLIREDARSITLATEGGHVGFAPATVEQSQVLNYLQTKFDRVSNERLLSGPGLVNIHAALSQLHGVEASDLTPADISAGAQDNNELCLQTFDLFFEVLGQVAGDTVLGLGCYDGLFIAGGVAQRFPTRLENSRFRLGFENKGRYRGLMQTIPSWLIVHPNPGLLGAAVFASNRFVAPS